MFRRLWFVFAFLALALGACQEARSTARPLMEDPPGLEQTRTPWRPETPTPVITPSPTWTPSPPPQPTTVRFAVIGDYGKAGPAEEAVAQLVKSWNPDFIVTVGDNNYPNGSKLTFKENVLDYYGDFIEERRFFPALGNHDWGYFTPKTLPFVEFFDYLPGNRRYYDIVWGPVHLFVLDSGAQEPDGLTPDSKQGQWLRERLRASTTPWQIVAFHHAPYSSGRHGDTKYMQWPFAAWGVDLVLTGHDHTYERIHREGIVYIVNGLGGAPNIYSFENDTHGSQVRYNDTHGALWVEVTADYILGRFINIKGETIDEFRITQGP